ncbi:hypothetical protein JOE30_004157 [Rhodococcus sp. PvP016]|nr:hypothetical protein [Rhodococcus sp. PvP016]
MAALVLCGACSPGVSGEPVAELWDPCTIPSDALTEAGVNPEIVDSGQVDQGNDEWRFCSFRQDWFVLTISSTTNAVSEFRGDSRSVNAEDIDVGGRPALSFQQLPGTLDEACHIAYASTAGAIEFAVRNAGDPSTVGDYCAEATRISGALESATPP